MQTIRADIYEALMVTPVTVYPQSQADSLGDTIDETPTTYQGYVYENTEKVINTLGEDDVSNIQIYLKGDDASAIDVHSLISCLHIAKSRILARQVYRGRAGNPVIGVIYLP